MARGRNRDLCDTPGCGQPITNRKRELCSRCDGNRHYWLRKQSNNPKAVVERKARLGFLTNRLSWLFDERGGE
jgi:hypothetical protein